MSISRLSDRSIRHDLAGARALGPPAAEGARPPPTGRRFHPPLSPRGSGVRACIGHVSCGRRGRVARSGRLLARDLLPRAGDPRRGYDTFDRLVPSSCQLRITCWSGCRDAARGLVSRRRSSLTPSYCRRLRDHPGRRGRGLLCTFSRPTAPACRSTPNISVTTLRSREQRHGGAVGEAPLVLDFLSGRRQLATEARSRECSA